MRALPAGRLANQCVSPSIIESNAGVGPNAGRESLGASHSTTRQAAKGVLLCVPYWVKLPMRNEK